MFPNHEPEGVPIEVSRGTPDELPFYCVSPAKFSILSLATFGLYEIFWFYKNWALVKERSGQDIRPFWRAFFSPLFCRSFVTTVNSAAEPLHVKTVGAVLTAVLYFVLLALSRLPDPYWLVSLFSFVPLVPVVLQIRAVHEAVRPGFDSSVGWGRKAYATLAVGSVVTFLALVGTFGPPSRVLRQSEVPPEYQTTLQDAGMLEPGEHIQYFYSSGAFSILEDGNFFTERRVIRYVTAGEELIILSFLYSEIQDVDVTYSDNSFDSTNINVTTLSGQKFTLSVPTEEGLDKEFAAALLRLFRTSRQP